MLTIDEKDNWIELLLEKLKATFGNRLLLVMHVGSFARNDANENSDIDINVILDTVEFEDVLKYREIVLSMPNKHLACGFLGSKSEITSWPKFDLMAFYYGCKIVYGDISIIPNITKKEIYSNILINLSNISHFTRHSIIYDKNIIEAARASKELYKGAFFVIQGFYLIKQDVYIGKRKELLSRDIARIDKDVLNAFLNWDENKIESEHDALNTLKLIERWSSDMFSRLSELNIN